MVFFADWNFHHQFLNFFFVELHYPDDDDSRVVKEERKKRLRVAIYVHLIGKFGIMGENQQMKYF